jgi:hypothetical protein
LKFQPSTVADEKALAEWLAAEVCPVGLVEDRQREALLVECRARKVERPLPLAARRDEHFSTRVRPGGRRSRTWWLRRRRTRRCNSVVKPRGHGPDRSTASR